MLSKLKYCIFEQKYLKPQKEKENTLHLGNYQNRRHIRNVALIHVEVIWASGQPLSSATENQMTTRWHQTLKVYLLPPSDPPNTGICR